MYDLKPKQIEDINDTTNREKTFEQAVLDATNVIFNNKIPKFDYENEEMFRSNYEMKKIQNKVLEERKNDRSLKYFERQMKKAKTIKRKETGFEQISQNLESTKAIEMSKYRDSPTNTDSTDISAKSQESGKNRREENRKLRKMSKTAEFKGKTERFSKMQNEPSVSQSSHKDEQNNKKKHEFKSNNQRENQKKHHLRDTDEGSKSRQKSFKHDGTPIKRMKFRNSMNRSNNRIEERNETRKQDSKPGYVKKEQFTDNRGNRQNSGFQRRDGSKPNQDFQKFSNFKKPSVLGRSNQNKKVFKDNFAKFQKKSTNRPGKARRAESRERIKQSIAKAS